VGRRIPPGGDWRARSLAGLRFRPSNWARGKNKKNKKIKKKKKKAPGSGRPDSLGDTQTGPRGGGFMPGVAKTADSQSLEIARSDRIATRRTLPAVDSPPRRVQGRFVVGIGAERGECRHPFHGAVWRNDSCRAPIATLRYQFRYGNRAREGHKRTGYASVWLTPQFFRAGKVGRRKRNSYRGLPLIGWRKIRFTAEAGPRRHRANRSLPGWSGACVSGFVPAGIPAQGPRGNRRTRRGEGILHGVQITHVFLQG